MAEAKAVLAGFIKVRRNGFDGAHILMDGKEVVKALKGDYD